MPARPLIEICVDCVEAALVAEENGADRIELCADLLEGGTAPSYGTIAVAIERLQIPVMVMIRPRPGDFCYSEIEFEIMKRDVAAAKSLGARGVVFGILNPDGSVDVGRTSELVRLAEPMEVTFHRAFDWTAQPLAALEEIVRIGGIQRILTSGQQKSVLEGLDLIVQLVKAAAGRITILPGGDVNPRTLPLIQHHVALAGCPPLSEVHCSASTAAPSAACRNSAVSCAD
ncbi:copper homeostasis protein cutC [Hyaloraphidium curvatum]|nr:copper homeostasis protein cutC [Hyaloraphidium curvatum]